MQEKQRSKKSSAAFAGTGALPGSLVEFLAARSEVYASLPVRQQATLAGFLFAHDMKRYRHRENDELQVLHWYVLRLVFKDKFHEINEQLGWFALKLKHREGLARGWAVTEEAEALVEEFAFSDHIARSLIDWQGNPMRKPRSAFAPYIASSMTKSRFRGSKLHAHVEIDADSLLGLVKAGFAWRDGEPCPQGYEFAYAEWDNALSSKGRRAAVRRVRRSIIQAKNLMSLAIASSPSSFAVPVVYQEVASGRVFAEGVTPQGSTREVKQAALHGCWEYDMENAHWTFLYQLAKRIDPSVELPEIEQYLRAKPFYRKRIANESGITIQQAKDVLLSLIYGAALHSKRQDAAIPSIVDAEHLPALREAVRLLCRDMNKAKRLILQHYEAESRRVHRKNVLVNDAGRIYRRKDAQENEANSKLAHILQGLESEALRACVAVCGDDIALLQHDGFACRQRADRAALVAAIEERTGIVIDMSEARL